MRFVKTDDLKNGMRIGRPIYNRQGVLLFDRDARINDQIIGRIRNFGLIGIFILEPAEPLPPLSEEDKEFERFQTINVYALADELDLIIGTKHTRYLEIISNQIVAAYGHLNHKINFIQNIRSHEDYICKHSLNVAILCALMCHQMNISIAEVNDTMLSALIHDIGKKMVDPATLIGLEESEILQILDASQGRGFELIDGAFSANPNIRRICAQAQRIVEEDKTSEGPSLGKIMTGAKILAVAETFDAMTAMSPAGDGQPKSFVSALRYLNEHEAAYNKKVVEALVNSINIIYSGVSVELSNGTKALVLNDNPRDILNPTVLTFGDNMIIDLSDKRLNGDLHIVDIVKTMDERYKIDSNALAGFDNKG